jgi:hypothetical protein
MCSRDCSKAETRTACRSGLVKREAAADVDALALVAGEIARHDAVDRSEGQFGRIAGSRPQHLHVLRAVDPQLGSDLLEFPVEDASCDARELDFGIEQTNGIDAADVLHVNAEQAPRGLQIDEQVRLSLALGRLALRAPGRSLSLQNAAQTVLADRLLESRGSHHAHDADVATIVDPLQDFAPGNGHRLRKLGRVVESQIDGVHVRRIAGHRCAPDHNCGAGLESRWRRGRNNIDASCRVLDEDLALSRLVVGDDGVQFDRQGFPRQATGQGANLRDRSENPGCAGRRRIVSLCCLRDENIPEARGQQNEKEGGLPQRMALLHGAISKSAP